MCNGRSVERVLVWRGGVQIGCGNRAGRRVECGGMVKSGSGVVTGHLFKLSLCSRAPGFKSSSKIGDDGSVSPARARRQKNRIRKQRPQGGVEGSRKGAAAGV